MKKILLLFSGTSYSNSLTQFALNMARGNKAYLHVMFLSPSLEQEARYPFPSDLPLTTSIYGTAEVLAESDLKLIRANMQVFKHFCADEQVPCTIESNVHITLHDLIEHSAFSDLILCEAKTEVSGISIHKLLADSHCPVLLVSREVGVPQSAVFCYDESYSSILAIKMYSYLFPEWKDLPGTVLTINPRQDRSPKHDDYLSDWLPQHFTNSERQFLYGNLEREVVRFIRKGDKPTMVIMGAYGRTAASRLLRRSLAEVVIEETSACVFIMHE